MASKNVQGRMILFTAPSGAGKTTLVRHILSQYDNLDFSISATTRSKREGEEHGKDYYFLSANEFRQKISNDEFAEYEEVYEDQFYGTLKSEIQRIWNEGKHIVFDIDVKGAVNIKKNYGDACLAVFVRPPSLQVLIDRLTNRGTESESSLRKRIARVKREMTYENRFDTVVVNDLLEVAKKEAEYIVENFIYGRPFDTEEE